MDAGNVAARLKTHVQLILQNNLCYAFPQRAHTHTL